MTTKATQTETLEALGEPTSEIPARSKRRTKHDVTEAEVTDFVRDFAKHDRLDSLKEMLLAIEEHSREAQEQDERETALNEQGDGSAMWKAAETFEELCELSARWLEGTVRYSPDYGAEEPDEETRPLITILAALNRAGLLTRCSQPGSLPGDLFAGCQQRAFVSGFAMEPVAKRIAKLGLCTDLIAAIKPPGVVGDYIAPVTVDDYRPFTWAIVEPVDDLLEEVGTKARRVLKKAWGVMVFDPVWGREDYLWEQLAQELCFDPAPAHEELDTDFIA